MRFIKRNAASTTPTSIATLRSTKTVRRNVRTTTSFPPRDPLRSSRKDRHSLI